MFLLSPECHPMSLNRLTITVFIFFVIVTVGASNALTSVTLNNFWEESRVFGVVDLNGPGENFTIKELHFLQQDGNIGENLTVEPEIDSNQDVNNQIIFNYWNENENHLLHLGAFQTSFQQQFLGFEGFTIDGTHPINIFLQQYPINSTLSAMLIYAFLGFLLTDNDNDNKSKSYFGYSLVPTDIIEYFTTKAGISFPSWSVESAISSNIIEISYKNLPIFWSEILPNISLSLPNVPTSFPLTIPLLLHSSISYITLFDEIKLTFELINKQPNAGAIFPFYQIRQHFEISEINYLGINESLPNSDLWLNSIEIPPQEETILDLPLIGSLQYGLSTPFSVYSGQDAVTRLSQIGSNLGLSTLIGLKNYLFTTKDSETSLLPVSVVNSQGQKLNQTQTSDIPFQNYLRWQYEDSRDGSGIQQIAFYQLDTRGQDLFVSNDALYPVQNSIYSPFTQSSSSTSLMNMYNLFLKPFNMFLTNFTNYLNLPISPFLNLQADSFDVIVKSTFSPILIGRSGLIGYIPFLEVINFQDAPTSEIGIIQPTNGFTIEIISLVGTVIMLRRFKKRKMH